MGVVELVFSRGGEELLQVRLDRVETFIGRHPTNDVVLPDDAIPDVALVLIDRGAERLRLRNLTEGPLTVNGKSTSREELELGAGDALELGRYTLRLRIREVETARSRRTKILDGEGKSPSSAARIEVDGRTLALRLDEPFHIGSDPGNDLVLEDGFASSFHCRIATRDGRWFLSDLASTNGSYVNGLRVGEAELPAVAELGIGTKVLRFESYEHAPEERAPERAGMIGGSRSMRELFRTVEKAAPWNLPVLIRGPTGSGKELVARALHDLSGRTGPFLALNCGALAGSIIESELFGHVKGAFTGAASDRKGAFEAATGGTLFLDEIGELPLELQPKLLRVLESSAVRKIGGTQELSVDTRVLAATHQNIERLIEEGRFREDLFYRLHVVLVDVPPLSDRREDVPSLARHFLRAMAGPRPLELEPSAEEALVSYSWPGNVRELRSVIQRAVFFCEGGSIAAKDLRFRTEAFGAEGQPVRERVRRADADERQRIVAALEETQGNRAEAARLLGISKSTFHDRLKRLGIPPKFRP